MDSEIRVQMDTCDDNEVMQEFALMSISSFKYKGSDQGVNLLLSLNNPVSSMRKHGVNELSKQLENQVCEEQKVWRVGPST